ncbi:rSAM-associated Gly-rich repeat secreted protein [Synechococcus sp. RS9909]|nr:rSAM-associated Gly-rich repeat secreted protein [Synechococcus sp. RS9909]
MLGSRHFVVSFHPPPASAMNKVTLLSFCTLMAASAVWQQPAAGSGVFSQPDWTNPLEQRIRRLPISKPGLGDANTTTLARYWGNGGGRGWGNGGGRRWGNGWGNGWRNGGWGNGGFRNGGWGNGGIGWGNGGGGVILNW